MDTNDATKREMLELRLGEGWTLQRIADRYGCTREYVRQVIGNTGRIANRKTDKLKDGEFLAQTAYMSNAELAELLGLSEKTVANYRPKKLIRELINETKAA